MANILTIKSFGEYRGAIFCDDKLLYQGFPGCTEIVNGKVVETEGLSPPALPYLAANGDMACNSNTEISDYLVYKCLEGTLIRVFYHEETWYTSTSKKLNAAESRWGSTRTSFKESFEKEIYKLVGVELEDFYENNLDKNKMYFFVLQPTQEERIVVDPDLGVVFVGFEDETHNIILPRIDQTMPWKIPENRPINIDGKNPWTVEDVIKMANSQDPKKYQGLLLVYPKNEQFHIIKVYSEKYYKVFTMRDNTPSVKFAYLKLRNNSKLVELFKKTYPYVDTQSLENSIYAICSHLHALYLEKYIERKQTFLTPNEDNVLKTIHARYNATKNKTTKSSIADLLAEKHMVTPLNKLLRDKAFKEKKAALAQ